jgi:hypothetical protein
VKRRKKRLYVYEVGVPVTETWVFSVVASNKREAFLKASLNEGAHQLFSLGGACKYVRRQRPATAEDL